MTSFAWRSSQVIARQWVASSVIVWRDFFAQLGTRPSPSAVIFLECIHRTKKMQETKFLYFFTSFPIVSTKFWLSLPQHKFPLFLSNLKRKTPQIIFHFFWSQKWILIRSVSNLNLDVQHRLTRHALATLRQLKLCLVLQLHVFFDTCRESSCWCHVLRQLWTKSSLAFWIQGLFLRLVADWELC